MATMMEMAQTIRTYERAARSQSQVSRSYQPPERRIDVRDDYQVSHLCRLYGVSPREVYGAVDQVGNEMSSVVQRLLRIR